MRQTKSIIALNSKQETAQTEDFISKKIINSIGKDFIINPLNTIIDFQTVTLFPQKNISIFVEQDQFLLVLPLVGGLEVLNENKDSSFIENESVSFFSEIGVINFHNPFESDNVHFIFIKIESQNPHLCKSENIKFELDKSNQLVQIFNNKELNIKLLIGQFDARIESEHKVLQKNNCIAVYNISGVFEVDNKLLELNDALIMTDLEDFEYESLTNQSILLVLEC